MPREWPRKWHAWGCANSARAWGCADTGEVATTIRAAATRSIFFMAFALLNVPARLMWGVRVARQLNLDLMAIQAAAASSEFHVGEHQHDYSGHEHHVLVEGGGG